MGMRKEKWKKGKKARSNGIAALRNKIERRIELEHHLQGPKTARKLPFCVICSSNEFVPYPRVHSEIIQ